MCVRVCVCVERDMSGLALLQLICPGTMKGQGLSGEERRGVGISLLYKAETPSVSQYGQNRVQITCI